VERGPEMMLVWCSGFSSIITGISTALASCVKPGQVPHEIKGEQLPSDFSLRGFDVDVVISSPLHSSSMQQG